MPATADALARAGRLHILEVQRLMRTSPKAIIAVVNGWAAGGGHSLHVVADLTLASRQHGKFKQTDATVGSFDAGYGSALLARQVGQKRAREIFFAAREYSAEQMVEMGAVNEAVEGRDAFLQKRDPDWTTSPQIPTLEITIGFDASEACAKACAENVSIRQRHPPARPANGFASVGRILFAARPALRNIRMYQPELEEVPFVNLGLCGPHVVRFDAERANDPGGEAGLFSHLAHDGIRRRLALCDRPSGHLHTGDLHRVIVMCKHEQLPLVDDVPDRLLDRTSTHALDRHSASPHPTSAST